MGRYPFVASSGTMSMTTSPWFSQLGLSVRADSIAIHFCAGIGQDSAGRAAQNCVRDNRQVLRPPRTVHKPIACTARTRRSHGRSDVGLRHSESARFCLRCSLSINMLRRGLDHMEPNPIDERVVGYRPRMSSSSAQRFTIALASPAYVHRSDGAKRHELDGVDLDAHIAHRIRPCDPDLGASP
jgi:hypothetical protein